MKITIKTKPRTFVGQAGVLLISIGMTLFAWVPWVLALGVGLLIGDTIEVSADKEEDIVERGE